MSDLLFSAVRQPADKLRAILAEFLDPVTSEYSEFHGDWGSLAVACCAHDANVVVEDDLSLSVLLGEPIVSVAEMPRGIGGASRRQAIHKLLQGPADIAWDEHLDGPSDNEAAIRDLWTANQQLLLLELAYLVHSTKRAGHA